MIIYIYIYRERERERELYMENFTKLYWQNYVENSGAVE